MASRYCSESRPLRGWRFSDKSDSMSVGVETRTRIGTASVGAECRAECKSLLALAGCALAGAPTWPHMAGRGALCPGET